MKRLTEKDLEMDISLNEEMKENAINIQKIVLNKMVQDSNKVSSESSICNGVSSSNSDEVSVSEKVIGSSSVMVSNLQKVVEESFGSASVSQDKSSCTPKQDASLEAVAGVSVALVAIAENVIDLPESQKVLDQVKQLLKQENIVLKQENMMSILKITMECIEKSSLKGLSQKELAIQILNKCLEEAELDNASLQVMHNFLDTNLVGDTIDLIVAATKGQFDINKATKIATGCFEKVSGCFSRLFKRRSVNMDQNNNININPIINTEKL